MIKITAIEDPTGHSGHLFLWQGVFMVFNMALFINKNHMFLNHIDAYCFSMLVQSYFASPDYLVVNV